MYITNNINILKEHGYILKTKAGKIIKSAIKRKPTTEEILKDIELNHNHSWYQELYERNKNNLDDIALIYRGNNITYKEMFEHIDEYARSLKELGVNKGDEIPVCLTNTPEIIYIMGAISKIGASVNIFGPKFPNDYIEEIIKQSKSKIIFLEDNHYEKMKNIFNNTQIEKIVLISLSDSLKNGYNPSKAIDEKYESFDSKVEMYGSANSKILSQKDFISLGKNYKKSTLEDVSLNDDFMITYTSGSTNEKRPKGIVHDSRCYITVARYHNKDLNGGFTLKPLTFLAHIPTYSNSNILSIISDSLMQGAKLALEPIYDQDYFIESLKTHNPHYVAATKSFWVNTAKKILYDDKYKGLKLDNLIFAFSCGEPFEANEEKFINKAIKKAKAGIKVTHTPSSLIKMSEAGGDCEHGSIFYTLFRAYKNPLSKFDKKSDKEGMGTFPFVEIAVLDKDGKPLGKNTFGKIVANSPCTMKYYKNNEKATKDFFITDANGKEWADLKVYGYLDSYNKLHMKGRIPTDEEILPTFVLREKILKDTKNILSCEVTENKEENVFVANIEFQPEAMQGKEKTLYGANERTKKLIKETGNDLCFRIIEDSFPLTGSGKRDVKKLKTLDLSDCIVPIKENDNYYTMEFSEYKKKNQQKESIKQKRK